MFVPKKLRAQLCNEPLPSEKKTLANLSILPTDTVPCPCHSTSQQPKSATHKKNLYQAIRLSFVNTLGTYLCPSEVECALYTCEVSSFDRIHERRHAILWWSEKQFGPSSISLHGHCHAIIKSWKTEFDRGG